MDRNCLAFNIVGFLNEPQTYKPKRQFKIRGSPNAYIGVTSYSFYSIGVNTSTNKRISGEIKTFANRPFEHINIEVDGFYNFKPRPYHRFSIGLGVNVTPF